MKTVPSLLACLVLLSGSVGASPKQHVVAFGRWTTVKSLVGDDELAALDLKIRPLLVDGQRKEFTLGPPHEVTDHTFVVQRVFRLNDSLAQETASARWQWERGGWMLVNRLTGKMQQITLPEFEPAYSAAAWFRDYAAYCGVSDDGKKVSAVIVQLGRRKPLLKKPVGDATAALPDRAMPDPAMPDQECPAPVWQRTPSRVTFEPRSGPKFTFTVPTRSMEVVTEEETAGEE